MHLEWQLEQYDTDATWPTASRDILLLGVGTAICCVEQNSGRLKWETIVEGDIDAKPSIREDTGFAVDGTGRLYGINISTGVLLWSQGVDGNSTIPTVTDGSSVIVTTSEGLVSIDTNTGKYDWECSLPTGPSGPPAVTADTVYTGTEDGAVYAVSRVDGTVQWQTTVGPPLTRAGVAIENETLYAPTAPLHKKMPGAVHAVDTKTREVSWSVETPSTASPQPYLVLPPVIHDGTVYIVSGIDKHGKRHLQAIQEGQVIWSSKMDSVTSSPPTVTDSTVLMYSGGRLLAFERESGKQHWTVTVIGEGVSGYNTKMPRSGPVITEEFVFVRGPQKLVALSTNAGQKGKDSDRSTDSNTQFVLNPSDTGHTPSVENPISFTSPVRYPSTSSRFSGDGTVEWGFQLGQGGGKWINPMLVDDTVYLASSGGIATALDREDGTVRWLTQLDGRFGKCPLVADGTLFLVDGDRIFALDPRDGSVQSRDATLPDNPRQPTGQVATNADDVVSVGFKPDSENFSVTVNTDESGEWEIVDELPGYASIWDSYYGRIESTLFAGVMFKPGPIVFYALDEETETVQVRLRGGASGGVNIFSPPIRYEGRLFIAFTDNFYAVDSSD
jgi:outer membrane protein assembly factor BamB